MTDYDVIQVEFNALQRTFMRDAADAEGLTYWGVESLRGLEEAIDGGSSARVWVLGGDFPHAVGESRSWSTLPQAIDLIRARYENPQIVAYNRELETVARSHRVVGYSQNLIPASGFMKIVKAMLTPK